MNEFITNEQTSVLQKLVKEIVNDPKTYIGSRYLPSIALPTSKIRVEVVEASGGLTNEHVSGTAVKYVDNFGTRVQEFKAPKYKEAIHFDEDRILYLRELGQNDVSKRGIKQYIDLSVDRLNRRLEARIELLRWRAIFDGSFSYQGAVSSFGIPSANRVVPVGAVWSTNGTTANNSADPVVDIRSWLNGGTARFRKYNIKKIIMNPNTARWILDNTNTRAYLSSYGANAAINKYDINVVLGFLIPGCPEVEIYKGWYQTESLVASKLTVSDAVYFVRDGEIFFDVSLPDGDQIGEFVQGIHLAEGTMEQPGVGKFLVVEDNIPSGTKGGPANPYFDIIAGVYGGPKLDRPFDVLTAYVL